MRPRIIMLQIELPVVAFQIDGNGRRVKSLIDFVLQELGQLVAPTSSSGLLYKVLEDLACVIRGTKEGPVNALGSALHHRRRSPHQHNPENRAQSHANV